VKHLLMALSVALALSTSSALAQEPSGTTLQLDPPTRTNTPGQLVLSATLVGPNGKLLPERQIEFYQSVDLFGPREALLGGAVTDSTGVAVLLYLPVERGQLSLIARFDGERNVPKAEARATVDVVDTNAPLATEPLPFASLRPWLPVGIGAVVATVWSVLLGVFGYAVLKVRAFGRASRGDRT
jgi:hypothetical protein